MSIFEAGIGKWLQVKSLEEEGQYQLTFAEHHIGNTWIRSIHGGVSASIIEVCAEAETRKFIEEGQDVLLTSSTVDYLRVTKDADLFAKATIVRKSRRLSVVDVVCWQDDKNVLVARGTVTLKVKSTIF